MSTPVSALKIGKYYIDFNKMVGKGNTGNVFQGINTETQQKIAVKAIQMNQIQGQVTQYLLQSQKKALNTIKSPYIIKNLDIIQLKDQCLIVTQFCGKGSLKDYISKKQKLSNSQAIQLFKKILIGYIAISEALFIHRDLKTANILLRNNGEPVIIDFGYSQMMMAKRPLIQYNVGSPSYMAPQVYAKSRYSEKSDIWSLGVILHEMLTGKTLDHGYTDMHDFFRTLQKQGKPKINTQGMSQVCIQLLNMSLQVQPQKRGTCHKLKYLIDKSLIPQMQNQLNKVLGSNINRNQQDQSRVRKIIPHTHFNYETSQQTSNKYHNNPQQINTITSARSVQKPLSLSILPNSPTAYKQQIFKRNIYQNTISLKTIPNHKNYTNPIYPQPQPQHQSHLHPHPHHNPNPNPQPITQSHQSKQIIQKYTPTDRIQYPTILRNSFTGYNIQSQQKINYIHNVPYNTNYNQQILRSPQNIDNNPINLRIK